MIRYAVGLSIAPHAHAIRTTNPGETDVEKERGEPIPIPIPIPIQTRIPIPILIQTRIPTQIPIPTRDPNPDRLICGHGRGGEGNDDHYAVASTLKDVCDAKTDSQPDVTVLYLGDNFYNGGSTASMTASSKPTEDPYEVLDLPFYVALNYDYGETLNREKPVSSCLYCDVRQWIMPDEYYSSRSNMRNFWFNTNAIMLEDLTCWDGVVPPDSWLKACMEVPRPPGRLPWATPISNGAHGNAGEYEGSIGYRSPMEPPSKTFLMIT